MHRAGLRKTLLMTAGGATQSLPVSPHIQKLKGKAAHWCDPSVWKHSPEPCKHALEESVSKRWHTV